MKKNYFKAAVIAAGFAVACFGANAQSSDEILNLMINKKIITQSDADSLRAEAKKQKMFNITGSRLLQISAYTQIRYQSFQQAGVPDGADIRRARLDLRGNILPTWDYRLQLEFASSPKILDAYATFRPYDFFKFQAGQFKVPFSLENLTQSGKLEFIDRSQVVEALVARSKDVIGNQNGRDIGIMGYGSVLKIKGHNIVDYYIGGFDGQGINTPDKNEAKDFAGRLIFHPVAGLDVGGSYYNGYDNITANATPAVSKNFIRQRYGAELGYTWKNLSFKSEFINGKDGASNKNGWVEREGYYVQAAYFVKPQKFQVLAKYDFYDPDKAKTDNASTWYIFGLNYFFNDYTKIMVNWTNKQEIDGTEKKISNDLISAQLQIGF